MTVRRASLIALLVIAGVLRSVAGDAQQAPRVPRIGWVSTTLTANPHLTEAFRQGLRDLGYTEGRDIVIEFRSADSRLERFPALAAELVALKVDVIVAANTLAAQAAKQATSTIPIVFAGPADPVASGLVTSLAHPGGNVTGLSSQGPEIVGKSLELLKHAIPGLRRVAALWHRDYDAPTQDRILREAESAAARLGVHLQLLEARGGPESFERAFEEIRRARAEAVTVLTSVLFISERKRLVSLAAKYRMPAVYLVRDFVDDGGLMSYGPHWADIYRRAAIHVDKILKGAKPAELPVEQPTRFELVVNLKTARALGLTLPTSLLQRADDVLD